MTATLDREVVAQRLLGGSIKRSYQPEVDIDWDAPIDPHKYFLPPEIVSLYGTPYWAEMTEAQRIELSRQEMANVLSVGIWFENLLNRALLRELMHEDHRSAHVHYALTEMGDECRHMTMFGKVIDRVGARPYQMRMRERVAMDLLPFERSTALGLRNTADPDRGTEDVRICGESILPEVVTDYDDIRCTDRFVAIIERPAEERRHAQQREHRCTDFRALHRSSATIVARTNTGGNPARSLSCSASRRAFATAGPDRRASISSTASTVDAVWSSTE